MFNKIVLLLSAFFVFFVLFGCETEGSIKNDDRMEIERSLISPSGKYEAVVKRADMGMDVQKELAIINYENNNEIPVYLSEPAEIDGLWKNISPIKFLGDNDRYLQYFITDFVNEYKIFDIETQKNIDIWITGHYNNSFYSNGVIVVCSVAGEDGFEESIMAFLADDPSKKYFIFPEDLNGADDVHINDRLEVRDWLVTNHDTTIFENCSIQGNILTYNLTGQNSYEVDLEELRKKLNNE